MKKILIVIALMLTMSTSFGHHVCWSFGFLFPMFVAPLPPPPPPVVVYYPQQPVVVIPQPVVVVPQPVVVLPLPPPPPRIIVVPKPIVVAPRHYGHGRERYGVWNGYDFNRKN